MGCSGSAFVVNEKMPGQGHEMIKMAHKLGFTEDEVNTFYRKFLSYDVKKRGQITVDEFVVCSGLDDNVLAALVYRLFDKDKSGLLDLQEYIYACYNFLACDKDTLAAFTFQIFDTDSSGSLEAVEVVYMVNVIWGFKNKNKKVIEALKKLDEDKNGSVSRHEFVTMSKQTPTILAPAFEMQQVLRGGLLSESRWTELTRDREKYFHSKSVFDVLDRYTDKRTALEHSLSYLARVDHGNQKVPDKIGNKVKKAQQHVALAAKRKEKEKEMEKLEVGVKVALTSIR